MICMKGQCNAIIPIHDLESYVKDFTRKKLCMHNQQTAAGPFVRLHRLGCE